MIAQRILAPNAASPPTAAWGPHTQQDRHAIREQLERILLSSVFRNSRRYSSLLKYIVEQTLDGKSEQLKERTIGVEVFGRAANYDTNADHIVRSAAGEVRKRLAQYYMEPGAEAVVRIDVPLGSYVPQFQLPATGVLQDQVSADPPLADTEKIPPAAPASAGYRRIVVGLAAVAALTVLVAFGMGTRAAPDHRGTLDQFWRPILSSAAPVLVAIGNWDRPETSVAEEAGTQSPSVDPSMSVPAFHRQESQRVFLDDAIALARLVGLLQQKSKPYRILSHAATTFSDLHNGPAILIGFRSNYWTKLLVEQSPFVFEKGGAPGIRTIRDKADPARKFWSINLAAPYLEFPRDYALVLRVRDPKTEQMVVTAGGITCFGTLAAGEFLTDPNQIKKLEAFAPRGWEKKNIALVLSTDIIKASNGPPNIVAAKFW